MGAVELSYVVTGDSVEDAFRAFQRLLAVDIDDETWTAPFAKPGFVHVLDSPVSPVYAEIASRDILMGRMRDNRWSDAERLRMISPTKYGPWYVIQLAVDPGGGLARDHCWMFFGWVNR